MAEHRPAIVGGVVTALGGVAPPFERYSHSHKRIIYDYAFSHGYLPWGPFSESLTLSLIFRDQILRNIAITQLETALEIINLTLEDVNAIFMVLMI